MILAKTIADWAYVHVSRATKRTQFTYLHASVVLILAISFFRILYLFRWSPYDLTPDEAHYWDWSRHLDWSYYSKGPLVAWIIRAGVACLGAISLELTGSMTAAVRAPAAICGAMFLFAIHRLARRVFESERLSLLTVLIAAVAPTVNAFSMLMTIDAPYLTCWAWATVLGYEAVRENTRQKWALTGIVVAIGILAKYTMAIWIGSFTLFLLWDPNRRRLLLSQNYWMMIALSALSALPILIWNSQHDWVTFRHVAGQAGVSARHSGGFRWVGPFIFIGGQFAIFLGFWFIVGLWSMWANRPGKNQSQSTRYLWWLCVPTLVFFAAVSLLAPVQLNWAAGAYVTGLLLVIERIRAVESTVKSPIFRRLVVGFIVLNVLVSLIIHNTREMTSWISPLISADTEEKPLRIRQVDPTARMKGWRHFAGRIDEIRREFRDSGQEDPILTALRWDLPGEMAFYGEGQPPVYSLGLAMGDRHSQYDWWRKNPIADAQEFLGKTFIFVGVPGVEFVLEDSFDKVDPPEVIRFREGDRAVAQWHVWICRGFRGFGDLSTLKNNARH